MENLKLNAKKLAARSIIAFSIISAPATLTGCSKSAKCDIEENHAHAYTNEDDITRYVQSEKERYKGYNRTDSYIFLEGYKKDLNKFETKKDLIKIADNLDELIEATASNNDYYIYEFTYEARVLTGRYFTWKRRTGWTTDPDNIVIYRTYRRLKLTGNIKLAHYTYQTYKIITNDKDKYELVEGPVLDSIEDATSEYPYIKTDYATIVYFKVDELTNEQIKQPKLVD